MVPSCRSLFFAVVVVFASHAPGRSADEPSARVSKEYLTIVKVETRYLVRAVERLQETIIEELGGRKERKLYRQADEALSLLVDFERSLDAFPLEFGAILGQHARGRGGHDARGGPHRQDGAEAGYDESQRTQARTGVHRGH